MDNEWRRVGNEYLFECSIRDKGGEQITILQSWKNVVAVILHKNKTIVRTKKHYQYNTTMSIDKLAKTQKLTSLFMDEKTFYNMLCEKIGKDKLFYTYDKDVQYNDYGDDEPIEDEGDEDYEE